MYAFSGFWDASRAWGALDRCRRCCGGSDCALAEYRIWQSVLSSCSPPIQGVVSCTYQQCIICTYLSLIALVGGIVSFLFLGGACGDFCSLGWAVIATGWCWPRRQGLEGLLGLQQWQWKAYGFRVYCRSSFEAAACRPFTPRTDTMRSLITQQDHLDILNYVKDCLDFKNIWRCCHDWHKWSVLLAGGSLYNDAWHIYQRCTMRSFSVADTYKYVRIGQYAN